MEGEIAIDAKLQQKLMDRFPWFEARNEYTGEKLRFPVSCECGDGWYQLIYDCLQEVEEFCNKNKIDTSILHVSQVKEKYASLRIYFENYINEIDDIVNKYEELSVSICEICGEPGTIKINRGWWRCLCEKHIAEIQEIRDKHVE